MTASDLIEVLKQCAPDMEIMIDMTVQGSYVNVFAMIDECSEVEMQDGEKVMMIIPATGGVDMVDN